MIAQETIEEIKERTSLLEVASETVALKRQGANYVGLCPFHAEKTPSFHIREDKFYHCFGCGASGNVISFVMRSRGLGFSEAVEELARRLGIAVKREGGRRASQDARRGDPQELYRVNQAAMEFFVAALRNAEPAVKCYLEERGLSPKAIQAFGLGFASKGWSDLKNHLLSRGFKEELLFQAGLIRRNQRGESYDTFRARLMFPLFSDMRHVVGFGGRIIPALADEEQLRTAPKYLNSPESAVYEKNKFLYGLPQALKAIQENSALYLVEGYLDVIGLWQAGVKNVVATCGTALSEKHVRRLRHLAKKVLVLFDGDAPGRAAAGRAFSLFLNSGLDAAAVFLAFAEDPDSFARKHGPETQAKLVELGTVPLLDCLIDTLLAKYGVREARDLGAASKGRLCEELAEVLRKVQNSIELGELLQKAAMRLFVQAGDLSLMVEGKKQGVELKQPPAVDVSAASSRSTIPKVGELPPLDRELLQAVMVKKEQVIPIVLKDDELCSALQAVTLGFIDGLSEITCQATLSDEAKKESIRTLLKVYGDSWVRHWKKSHEMTKDPEVNFMRIVEGCRQVARKNKLNQAIEGVKEALAGALNEEEAIALMSQKLELERQLKSISQHNHGVLHKV